MASSSTFTCQTQRKILLAPLYLDRIVKDFELVTTKILVEMTLKPFAYCEGRIATVTVIETAFWHYGASHY